MTRLIRQYRKKLPDCLHYNLLFPLQNVKQLICLYMSNIFPEDLFKYAPERCAEINHFASLTEHEIPTYLTLILTLILAQIFLVKVKVE